ncbi:MAG: hypothetical protein ACT4O0_09350 [Pseudonocardia sp.]
MASPSAWMDAVRASSNAETKAFAPSLATRASGQVNETVTVPAPKVPRFARSGGVISAAFSGPMKSFTVSVSRPSAVLAIVAARSATCSDCRITTWLSRYCWSPWSCNAVCWGTVNVAVARKISGASNVTATKAAPVSKVIVRTSNG